MDATRDFSGMGQSGRPDTMTAAPDSANTCAQASPIPVVEPVTKTTFPAKIIDFLRQGAGAPWTL